MICLSWKGRGLGNLHAVYVLKELILSKKPNIIFLCEIIVHSNKIEEIKVYVRCDCCFSLDHLGRNGGLTVLWKCISLVTITTFASNYIDMLNSSLNNVALRLTRFYGYPKRGRRHDSWYLLTHLASSSSLPMACIVDFNDLLNIDDKRGGNPHLDYLLKGLKETIDTSHLIDLPLYGHNKWVRECLDRVLVTSSWLDMFANCKLINLYASMSDHSPIFLKTDCDHWSGQVRRFKFENFWLSHSSIHDVVRSS
ncbi:hypothetical protein P3X46_016912 [Hevea brasiliensis]|uniref:Endonuclease/exonuclease/phosphatase domain-containing protein n=1 Tax=Hevea brasiliensis TaxID=3981 RepID=A0ABQ9M0L7_HEVBR|nr:hypothetical protein P3X46_016912 [Hevea brasiliensis]